MGTLTNLADWIEAQLSDELASRQDIAETALTRIRALDARPSGPRVTAARQYLDAVRRHKVTARPHGALVREAAELRRQLGQVLDAVDCAPVLTAADLDTLLRALADAVAYRDPAGWGCQDCEASPAGLCPDHAADLDCTDAYLALAIGLGIGVDR